MNQTITAQAFIERWQGVTASELATAQTFVMDLCELLGVPKPHPTPAQDYMFERPVTFTHGDGSSSAGRVDCYKRGHFNGRGRWRERLPTLLDTLHALGRVRVQADGRWAE